MQGRGTDQGFMGEMRGRKVVWDEGKGNGKEQGH